ncbi:hypothetical protein BLNAU_11669 [Blattamonas nauphoetae]|uniref:Pecanex C-terminal domain-containing protein n=1 Tax=Blattamonas nauphoetae TaxID=2049346 RepID=A0ABQ9XLT8_9EUKA|nr:hypothetical protein BLNAU_11669 [Blattamonas nauphoetae]
MKSILSGMTLKWEEQMPCSVAFVQILLFFLPALVPIALSVLSTYAYLHPTVCAIISGAFPALVCLVMKVISCISLKCSSSPNSVHPDSNSDETEPTQKCCSRHTLSSIVSPSPYPAQNTCSNVVYIACSVLVVFVVGFVSSLSHQVSVILQVKTDFHAGTLISQIFLWISFCFSVYPLTMKAPHEYSVTTIHEHFLSFTRPFYFVFLGIFELVDVIRCGYFSQPWSPNDTTWLANLSSNYHSLPFRVHLVPHFLLLTLPVLFALGLTSPPLRFLLYIFEQMNQFCFGASPSQTTPGILLTFIKHVLSILVSCFVFHFVPTSASPQLSWLSPFLLGIFNVIVTASSGSVVAFLFRKKGKTCSTHSTFHFVSSLITIVLLVAGMVVLVVMKHPVTAFHTVFALTQLVVVCLAFVFGLVGLIISCSKKPANRAISVLTSLVVSVVLPVSTVLLSSHELFLLQPSNQNFFIKFVSLCLLAHSVSLTQVSTPSALLLTITVYFVASIFSFAFNWPFSSQPQLFQISFIFFSFLVHLVVSRIVDFVDKFRFFWISSSTALTTSKLAVPKFREDDTDATYQRPQQGSDGWAQERRQEPPRQITMADSVDDSQFQVIGSATQGDESARLIDKPKKAKTEKEKKGPSCAYKTHFLKFLPVSLVSILVSAILDISLIQPFGHPFFVFPASLAPRRQVHHVEDSGDTASPVSRLERSIYAASVPAVAQAFTELYSKLWLHTPSTLFFLRCECASLIVQAKSWRNECQLKVVGLEMQETSCHHIEIGEVDSVLAPLLPDETEGGHGQDAEKKKSVLRPLSLLTVDGYIPSTFSMLGVFSSDESRREIQRVLPFALIRSFISLGFASGGRTEGGVSVMRDHSVPLLDDASLSLLLPLFTKNYMKYALHIAKQEAMKLQKCDSKSDATPFFFNPSADSVSDANADFRAELGYFDALTGSLGSQQTSFQPTPQSDSPRENPVRVQNHHKQKKSGFDDEFDDDEGSSDFFKNLKAANTPQPVVKTQEVRTPLPLSSVVTSYETSEVGEDDVVSVVPCSRVSSDLMSESQINLLIRVVLSAFAMFEVKLDSSLGRSLHFVTMSLLKKEPSSAALTPGDFVVTPSSFPSIQSNSLDDVVSLFNESPPSSSPLSHISAMTHSAFSSSFIQTAYSSYRNAASIAKDHCVYFEFLPDEAVQPPNADDQIEDSEWFTILRDDLNDFFPADGQTARCSSIVGSDEWNTAMANKTTQLFSLFERPQSNDAILSYDSAASGTEERSQYSGVSCVLRPRNWAVGVFSPSSGFETEQTSLLKEQVYAVNVDDERFSIQTHPVLLRNICAQAMDPPFGYSAFSSTVRFLI